MISYKPMTAMLKARGLKKSDLTQIGVSSRTIAKIGKGERIKDFVLAKIASTLGCKPEDLYIVISENPVLQALRDEKEARIPGRLYHELQVGMTYNTNHIEGSKLTSEQTRFIFETNTIGLVDGVPVDDIIETTNHFRAVDYCIDIAEELLSESIIKRFHLILKSSTKDSYLEWFKVGDYKIKANTVGGHETAKPEEVPVRIKRLLDRYNAKENKTIEDIIEFHAEFEHIHPFQDGNGRVGRLIILKECLRNNIVPFYIQDAKKQFYYRGLQNWNSEKGWLTDTCLDAQDDFRRLLKKFSVPEA